MEASCGDRSLQNIYKYTSKTFLLSKYFFKYRYHVVNAVEHRTYPCLKKVDYPATSNSANDIYLLSFSTFHLQYLGEIAHQLIEGFRKYRDCFKSKVNPLLYRTLCNPFSKFSGYTDD